MAICNITCENDADFIRGFVYQTTATPPVPIDLTGDKLRMEIRHRAEDVTAELLLTTENGSLTITDAPNGKFTVWIKQAELLGLPLGDYEHSLIRIRSSGLHLRIWSGALTNNAGPSRGTNT